MKGRKMEHQSSEARRNFLKKIVYAAPVVVTLGALIAPMSAYASSLGKPTNQNEPNKLNVPNEPSESTAPTTPSQLNKPSELNYRYGNGDQASLGSSVTNNSTENNSTKKGK